MVWEINPLSSFWLFSCFNTFAHTIHKGQSFCCCWCSYCKCVLFSLIIILIFGGHLPYAKITSCYFTKLPSSSIFISVNSFEFVRYLIISSTHRVFTVLVNYCSNWFLLLTFVEINTPNIVLCINRY